MTPVISMLDVVNTEPSPTPRAHLLLVDDDERILRAFQRALMSCGYSVEVASTVDAAVTAFGNGAFDAVVSDIHMPDGSGLELLHLIRERDGAVPVLLMTGAPSLETATAAIEESAHRYLTKPVDLETLVEALDKAVKKHKLKKIEHKLSLIKELGMRDADELQERFERAIASSWMAYQPVVSWGQRRIIAYEALLRCDEPVLKNPAHFVRAASLLESLPTLGRLVREKVAMQLRQSGNETIFVNLHPYDLLDEELYRPNSPLAQVAPRVVLELTERAGLDEVPRLDDKIASLHELGFRVAIDDVGAGYSGLANVARLKPDIVKLDMELVRGIDRDERKQAVVRAMIKLSTELGATLVAEGIETASERDAVVTMGCDWLQGYLFARPGKPFQAVAW